MPVETNISSGRSMDLDTGEAYNMSIPLTDHFGHRNATPSADHGFMTSVEDGFVVTDVPKRDSGSSRYPERLLQLFAALWRDCEIKMQTEPPFELGKLFHFIMSFRCILSGGVVSVCVRV